MVAPDLTELQELAGPLLPHAHLRDIRLFRLGVEHEAFGRFASVELANLDIDLQTTSLGPDPAGMAVVLQVNADLVASSDQDDEGVLIATLAVAYGAIYVMHPEAEAASEEQARAFGLTVGAMALWPYIRAAISGGIRELGYGTLAILPTLTQADLVQLVNEADQEDEAGAEQPQPPAP